MPEQNKCPECGQFDIGQYGEYPCQKCGLPTEWGNVPERMTPEAWAMMQEKCEELEEDHEAMTENLADRILERNCLRLALERIQGHTDPEVVSETPAPDARWIHTIATNALNTHPRKGNP